MKNSHLYIFSIVGLMVVFCPVYGQTVSRYNVYKLENKIGMEEVVGNPKDKDSTVHISIKTNDRGTDMHLEARFSASNGNMAYWCNGNTSRFKMETIDTTWVQNKDFPIDNNGSIKMRELLVAFWEKASRPGYIRSVITKAPVKILVIGTEPDPVNKGELTVVKIGDNLDEILWVDKNGQALFLTTCDSEGDKREVINNDYLSAFKFFSRKSTQYLIDAYQKDNSNLGERFADIAVIGGNIVDLVNEGKVIDNTMVLLKNGKIVYVGVVNKAIIPPGAHIIDAYNKFLIPGLWNMHVHLFHPDNLKTELLSGVTTVRDMGNEFDFICSIKNAANNGSIIAPHIFSAGLLDGNSSNSLGIVRAGNTQQIRENIKKYHDAGFDQIKVYSYVTKASFDAIVKEAALYNMPVVGHLPNGYTVGYFIENGMNSISHIHYFMNNLNWTGPNLKTANTGLLNKMVEKGIYLDPTINVYALTGDKRIALYQKLIKLFFDYGVPIVAGTDNEGTVAGEIENYAKSGLSPLDAIRAATIVPASIMKMNAQSGSIENGKDADLLLLNANPLIDISTLDKVNTIIKGQLVIKK